MIPWNEDGRRAPSPEQLAAYGDGELDRPELAPLKGRVEDWLAAHPEAAAAVDKQRRLAQLWQATTPAEPSESAWAAILTRLEHLPPRPVVRPRWRAVGWVAGLLAACAAAVWLMLVLLEPRAHPERVDLDRPRPDARGKTNAGPKLAPAPAKEEPFAVATADEVEILSVRGADTNTLVVGELPVRGEIELPTPGEVEVQTSDAVVRVGVSPMIWTPLGNERDDP